MRIREQVVATHRERLLRDLEVEARRHGGYRQWHAELAPFRESLARFYRDMPGEIYRIVPTTLPCGDNIDHHIISYLAPLEYQRVGWNDKMRTASEQIILLWKYLKERGTRLIYAPLPNKGMVYPELISDVNCVRGENAPQYRKMMHDISWGGVEIVDLFPAFLQGCGEELFSKNHNISSCGAQLAAHAIAEYLQDTTELPSNEVGASFSCREKWIYQPELDHPVRERSREVLAGDGMPYWNQNAEESKIAIFGDCNLQGYQGIGGGIAANLAYDLRYPVSNEGRYLPFDYVDSVTKAFLDRLQGREIAVYVGFASASFVRSTQLNYRNLVKTLRLHNPWSTLALE